MTHRIAVRITLGAMYIVALVVLYFDTFHWSPP
jgi:hypothetical protein